MGRFRHIAAWLLIGWPLAAHALVDTGDWLHSIEDGVLLFFTSAQYPLLVVAAALLTSERQQRYFHYTAFLPLALGILSATLGYYILEQMPFSIAFARGYLIFLGLLVVLDARFREGITALLVLIAGLLAGMEYAFTPTGGRLSSAPPIAGFLASAIILFAVVDFLANRYRSGWQRIAIRVMGSWIMAIALLNMAFLATSSGLTAG